MRGLEDGRLRRSLWDPPPGLEGVKWTTKSKHDADGEHIFDMCGPMLVGAHAVKKLSCNTAELRSWVVFLRWERERGGGRPVLVRCDSKYAAMITCATWRAKRSAISRSWPPPKPSGPLSTSTCAGSCG